MELNTHGSDRNSILNIYDKKKEMLSHYSEFISQDSERLGKGTVTIDYIILKLHFVP